MSFGISTRILYVLYCQLGLCPLAYDQRQDPYLEFGGEDQDTLGTLEFFEDAQHLLCELVNEEDLPRKHDGDVDLVNKGVVHDLVLPSE
jgi:hypothetical protein